MRFYVYGFRGRDEFMGAVVEGDGLARFVADKRRDGWTLQWRPVEHLQEAS